jgi:hypothetical protein
MIMKELKQIQWPEYFHPKNAPVHVRNEKIVPTDCEQVWNWIVRAPCWPNWQHRRTQVQIVKGDSSELHKGTVFNWVTKTMHFECTVVEYEPFERIAWRGKTGGVDMYHAWLITPCTQGCHIITESTQRGGLRWLTGLFVKKQVNAYHQHWLETLAAQKKS